MRVREIKQYYSNYQIFVALGAMICLSLIATIAAVLAITQLLQARQAGQRHNTAHVQLESLFTSLETAEAGQRGYLLTGDPTYLTSYQKIISAMPGQLRTLEQGTLDAPYHADVLKLRPLVEQRLDRLKQGIQIYNSGDQDAVVAYIKTGQGRILMDQIHSQITIIEQQQTALLNTQRQRIEALAGLARAISIATLVLMLLLAMLIYYLYTKAMQADRALDLAKDEFVSLASHQLRTPASGIKSILATILAGDLGQLNQQQKYFLNKALDSNEREIRIIDELLNVARADAGRLVLRPSQVDLTALINTVAAEQRPALEAKHLSLQLKLPSDGVTLTGDQEKIFMAVSNLLDNARKYTPEHGKITMTLRPRRGNAVIEVTDSGIGIDQAELVHIFDRFQRAHNVLTGNIEGTGLGLYLVRRIVELHNGAIEVSSKKGHGTKFIMSLPVRRA